MNWVVQGQQVVGVAGRPADLLEQLQESLELLLAASLDRPAHRHGHQRFEDLVELLDQLRIGQLFELQQGSQDVEARVLEGHDARSALADVGQPELLERLQGLAYAAAVDPEALGEVAFGREALTGAVLPAQDLVA
jgi:hypothetical protein